MGKGEKDERKGRRLTQGKTIRKRADGKKEWKEMKKGKRLGY